MALTALFTGASGLTANSTALDVVGNNLANLNTTGYKTQRTLFRDQVYQIISSGSAGSGAVGGTNAAQLGYGVNVGAVDTLFTQGAVNPTGRPLDAAIQGQGFFVLRSATGEVYSRAGSFGVDANGFLVDPSTGARVQRTGTVGDGSATSPGFQVAGNNDIRVPFGAGASGNQTTSVLLQGNISRDLTVGQTVPNPPSIQIFDTQSAARTLATVITKTGTNAYTLTATVDGVPATVTPTPITFDGNGLLVSPGTLTVSFAGVNGANAQTVTLNIGTPGQATGMTQFGGASTAAAVTQDGTGAGSLTDVSIDNNGNVQGTFTNGRTIPLAQLALATFNNEGGLIRQGSNYFATGPGSGQPLVGPAGSGGRGLVQGSALEGSSVDIAIEFSRLILAQRGFQVNSRTISAANETLQELANIIR